MLTKPIKRNENMLILSREHHFGLLFCWKIKQGIKKNIETERIQKYITYFWDSHLRKHFDEEENFLFLNVRDTNCEKAIEQHEELRESFSHAEADDGITFEDISRLADSLHAHIRFEERELFPHLERTMDKNELKKVGALLLESHSEKFSDEFPDEFWI